MTRPWQTPLWHDLPREKGVTQMEIGDFPMLSLNERDRRWTELRKRMSIRQVDALLLFGSDAGYGRGFSNFRYVTHFADSHGAWAIFPIKGECTIMCGPRHIHLPHFRYKAFGSWVSDFRPDYGINYLIAELKEREQDKSRIAIVTCPPSTVSLDLIPQVAMEKLRKELPDVEFVDGNVMIAEMRIIKSEEELGFLYKAAELARKQVEALINGMQVGRTEADLYAEMFSASVRNGGEPQLFNLMATGNVFDDDPGFKFLLHGCSQPGCPTMRKLRDGDLAICEFHTQYGGYMSGCEFSVFLGNAPKELREIHAACMEALDTGIKNIKPGATMGEAWRAMRKAVLDRGMDFVELGFHGHGLASPEFPDGGVYREEEVPRSAVLGDVPFEEDMTVVMNIDVHNPNWRKDVGLKYGEMLHITKDGAKPLINFPREFICNKA